MKIHSVIVSYNRLPMTQKAVSSYLETVTLPHTLVIVDNGSTDGTREWLMQDFDYGIHLLNENKYPGFACNRGWEMAPPDAIFLHRADNDFSFRAGWDQEVVERFAEDPKLGQLGLLTDIQEAHCGQNVGGNCVIRRELWDKGLRYDERPWPEMDIGYSEDSYFSPAVEQTGYCWGRVTRTCIDGLSTPDPKDSYYKRTYRDRGIAGLLKGIKSPGV